MSDEHNLFGIRLGPGAMLLLGILAGAGGGKGMDLIYPPAPDRFTGSQGRALRAEMMDHDAELEQRSKDRDAAQQVQINTIAGRVENHDRYSTRKVEDYDKRLATLEERVAQLLRELQRHQTDGRSHE